MLYQPNKLLVLFACTVATTRGETQEPAELRRAREQMVAQEVAGAGVKLPRVLSAMRTTPRHEFVPLAYRRSAYLDMALPIGESQTISPPFIVAYMTEQLDPQPEDKVLEIGTGSGYQAAVLSPLVRQVYSIEIVPQLGRHAARTLKRLGYNNVFTRIGDGYLGWPEAAPFDKIIVTCSPESVPPALVEQLAEGGRMIVPVGERHNQAFYLFRKQSGKLVSEALRATLFVPMTGRAEERRSVLPDPLHPKAINGGFEDLLPRADAVDSAPLVGWYYVRQAEVVTDSGDAPEGDRFVRFKNDTPGRGCQALQGIAVDGKKVSLLTVEFRARGKGVRSGATPRESPHLGVAFYDKRRVQLAYESVGELRGDYDWFETRATVEVPVHAEEAFLRIGLLGGTGQLDLDDVRVGAAPNGK